MTRSRAYQVKEVARLAGVSARTLHHYDSIGLLMPATRTSAGYRLYTDADLLRLQQILISRELGLTLEEIRRSLDDPRFDRKAALLDQRERLKDRARQAEAIIRAIDVAMAADDGSRGSVPGGRGAASVGPVGRVHRMTNTRRCTSDDGPKAASPFDDRAASLSDTECPSTVGSTRAATGCIVGWPRCTRAMIGSGKASTSTEKV